MTFNDELRMLLAMGVGQPDYKAACPIVTRALKARLAEVRALLGRAS